MEGDAEPTRSIYDHIGISAGFVEIHVITLHMMKAHHKASAAVRAVIELRNHGGREVSL
jgi:hypothetical protein